MDNQKALDGQSRLESLINAASRSVISSAQTDLQNMRALGLRSALSQQNCNTFAVTYQPQLAPWQESDARRESLLLLLP